MKLEDTKQVQEVTRPEDVNNYIKHGWKLVNQYVTDSGGKVKQVGDPLYFEPLSIAFDKKDPVANATLVAAVSKIVQDMHADGTLSSLSEKWYKTDLTTNSASS